MSEMRDLNWIKTKQDQKVKNFGMVGMGYVVEMHNYHQEELKKYRDAYLKLREAVELSSCSERLLNVVEEADEILGELK